MSIRGAYIHFNVYTGNIHRHNCLCMVREHTLAQLSVKGACIEMTMYREHMLTKLSMQGAYIDTTVCTGSVNLCMRTYEMVSC